MSASSFTYSTALAGQGLSFSGTGSPDSGAQATGSLRPSRLELQAVLARAQARKGSLAQAATDELPVTGLGLPAQLFPPALRGNVGPTQSHPSTPAITSRMDASPIGDADRSLPSTPFSTPAEHMYIPGKTCERPSVLSMPEFTQDGGRALFGLGMSLPEESVVTNGAFPGPYTSRRRIMEDSASDPIVTPGELMQRNFPLTPGAPLNRAAAPNESGRYFPLTPGVPVHAVAAAGPETDASNFHRTPGAPLHRQPSRVLYEGLLRRWHATPMSQGWPLFANSIPLPTPLEVV
ncbi:hypothetical protein C8Q72DRAFT_941815 [Fomitopsis betulina]|nr:hypothetical protein C8Q72DRAFT_941815 [Fomitopsis betulina]